ncbi:ankyrin repeat and SOCS box protein 13-like [Ptychodera flava]|uniref:ankyrin repeat and SOCS box protein 13-like n=1 Tax=Ptychodera flava TaxID=63121 RepID=UPI00396A10F3
MAEVSSTSNADHGPVFGQEEAEDANVFFEDISFYFRNWSDLSPEYQKDFKSICYQLLEEDDCEKFEIVIKEGFGANITFRPREYLNFPTQQTVISRLRQFGVGQYDMTALQISLALFSTERPTNRCLELLLKYDASTEMDDSYPNRMDPMYMACKTENFGAVELLLKYSKTAADEIYLDLIHKKPHPKRLEILKALLQHGDPLMRPFYQSNYLLHMAALDRYENTAHLELLVSCGADLNVTNGAGCTALYSAASMGNLAGCQYLHQHGCQVNVDTNDGCSPLHLAFKNQMTKCVPFLIDIVDDINKVDSEDHTPLDYAMICGPVFHEFNTTAEFFKNVPAEKYIKLMLNNGALLNKFNKENFKAFLRRSSTKVELLALLFSTSPNLNFIEFDDCGEDLFKWFPGFGQEILELMKQPRSLKHFCRHSLRVSLGKRYLATLEASELPPTLHKYLVFDDPRDLR